MGSDTTPARAIRARCLDCVAGNDAEVRRCEMTDCQLYPLRMGRGVKGLGGLLNPIRRFCLWCVRGQVAEVRDCPSEDRCELHPYRMGRRPAKTAPEPAVEARTVPLQPRPAPGATPAYPRQLSLLQAAAAGGAR